MPRVQIETRDAIKNFTLPWMNSEIRKAMNKSRKFSGPVMVLLCLLTTGLTISVQGTRQQRCCVMQSAALKAKSNSAEAYPPKACSYL